MKNQEKILNEIEKKFESLKFSPNLQKQSLSIYELIESLTQGKLFSIDVHDTYSYVNSLQNVQQKAQVENLTKNFKDLTFQQIKNLIQKVISHKNQNKNQNKDTLKQQSPQNPSKKKSNKFSNDAHQNPYIPPKIQLSKKSKQTEIFSKPKQENQMTSTQKQIKQLPQQKIETEEFHQTMEKQFQESDSQEQLFHLKNDESEKDQLNLPLNFKSLPVQERYSILSKKQGKNKEILQKRFDQIYKHYRKEMYIPYESFQVNNELLMDLRIFLKYFKDFDMAKKFKTNQALKYFKKLASNGLWLDDKNFIKIHYKLIQLLDTNLFLQNFDSTDPQKVNQIKRETLNNIKYLKENLIKLKDLQELISENKIKQVFRTGKTQTIVKKIIESHSGLSQQDVIQKLKERADQRKNKKSKIFNIQKINTWSPDKNRMSKINDNLSPRSNLLHEISIYKQIELPKFRSRQMRSSSVYSALQILNMEKQKQRLKELVRQKDNEKYLQQFFKKQKTSPLLGRSNSLGVVRTKIKDETQTLSINSSNSSNNRLPKIKLLQKNFSLPRMKFT